MPHLGKLGVPTALAGPLALALSLAADAGEVLSWGDARLIVGADASASAAIGDEGWFNEKEYGRSVVHLARFSVSGEVRIGERIALLSEFRTENLDAPQAYALYLRLRPWAGHAFDVQAGRIPPVFGAYPRRRYAADNPLIGEPLAYQYLTTLRTDAVPRTADELLAQRGEGWLVAYSVGSSYAAPGVSLVSATRWDTGIEVHAGSEALEGSLALTQGSLCDPQTRDDNEGKQLSARLAVRPALGVVLGISAARGDYLSREVTDVLPPGSVGPYRQRAFGFDAEWSHGYWILRAEAVWSRWDVPAIEPPHPGPLSSIGAFVEGRYKIAPRLYVAGRVDHLGFTDVSGSEERLSWDAPVTRVETGLGFSPVRNLWLKAVYQHNWRDGGGVRSQSVGAGQISWWF